MARIARIVSPRCPHHITQRGVSSMRIFYSHSDREEYLRPLSEQGRPFGVAFLAYCLIPNQVHFLAIPETATAWHAALSMNPLLLMVPATVSASCAFMLPIGTPPNAIVFASGRVSLMRMARTGLLLNLIGAAFVTAFVYFVVIPAFGISLGQPPLWIK
ncbi:MAG: anion permease [Candidatus Hydrogenedentota bacterium]|nr:MAG: anion permease [Candidatus Hydrogenedentota bacterium]